MKDKIKKINKEKKKQVVKRALFKDKELKIKTEELELWYEVFERKEGTGSRTLAICYSLKEAVEMVKFFKSMKEYKNVELYVNKWENKDKPEELKEIK